MGKGGRYYRDHCPVCGERKPFTYRTGIREHADPSTRKVCKGSGGNGTDREKD